MALRLDMTVSLDGFVAGPDDSPHDPLGVGGFRLFDWLDRRLDPGPAGEVYAEAMATRAVLSGRRTYEHAGRWGGDHHDGVPIVVLTHAVPDEPPPGSVVYATDVRDAAARARAAAGDGDVVVMGAGAGQALLAAGELDEIELHVVPVLLGQGRRLFGDLPGHVELELVRRLGSPPTEDLHRRATHLRYRVRTRPDPAVDSGAASATS
ncbi:dihydrofolate reductase family protein [Actinomycetospora sp. CA-101289]|uniref:dihydrofolate reductase family protein n=1 Tax=Actinomycetospora sp. CA-101289 TaxID=3239893 RepID=UPI003D95EF6D